MKLVNIVAFITFPIYFGAFFLSDELISVVLGSKWLPIIVPFKLLCISQLIISITSTNGIVINAKGLPHWNLYVNIINVLILPVSFYVAAKYGLNYLVIPWLTVQPLVRLGHTWVTLRLLDISVSDYFLTLVHPLFGTITMSLVLTLIKYFYFHILDLPPSYLIYYLFFITVIGAISYASYVMTFRRDLFTAMKSLRTQSD